MSAIIIYVTIYAEVDDIPAYLAKAETLGGSTMVSETEVPGQGHFAWLKDIDSNIIGLWKPQVCNKYQGKRVEGVWHGKQVSGELNHAFRPAYLCGPVRMLSEPLAIKVEISTQDKDQNQP